MSALPQRQRPTWSFGTVIVIVDIIDIIINIIVDIINIIVDIIDIIVDIIDIMGRTMKMPTWKRMAMWASRTKKKSSASALSTA